MQRRAYLRTAAAGATLGVAGCAGGNVVHSVQKTVTVTKGRGWIEKLPAKANKIKFILRDKQPFDLYVFTDPDNVQYYQAFIDDESPEKTPPGDRSLGGRALPLGNGVYQVATEDKGRQSLDGEGPAYFVVDHSEYRGETPPGEERGPLSVTVDLEVVESTLPI